MVDFFTAQDHARRNTGKLVLCFVLAIVVMILGIYVTALLTLHYSSDDSNRRFTEPVDWIQPEIFFAVTVVVLVVIGGGSLYKIVELRRGGEAVALMLGGRRIHPNTTDLNQRRLLNVVEEMAIASGVAVPPVFLLQDEPGINAFAAGFTPDDAVIGINQGTLDYLTRDELQGVIAHEFSHILNGDMRFNLRLIGLLHGILLIGLIGYFLMRSSGRSSSNRESGGGVGLGLALFVIGYAGLFAGRMIKAGTSRQREYLADASAVQFTRNPESIGGALKKIGGAAEHSKMETAEAESISHMFFGDAFMRSAHSMFATHPPLQKRIRRVDPHFDGKFPVVKRIKPKPVEAEVKKDAEDKKKSPLEPILATIAIGDKIPLDPAAVIATVGSPNADHVQASRAILQAIPEELHNATHEVFSARAFVFALLMDQDSIEVREAQQEIIKSREGDSVLDETNHLFPLLQNVTAASRVPILELIQGTLRDQSLSQYEQFREIVDQLIKADKKISLFEFVLQQILLKQLDRVYGLIKPPVVRYHSMNAVARDLSVLISALAHLGHKDDAVAAEVYAKVVAGVDKKIAPNILPKSDCNLQHIGNAMARLAECSPPIKKRALTAAASCIAADGHVTVGEAELFRAIASSIDCPVPPVIADLVTESDALDAAESED